MCNQCILPGPQADAVPNCHGTCGDEFALDANDDCKKKTFIDDAINAAASGAALGEEPPQVGEPGCDGVPGSGAWLNDCSNCVEGTGDDALPANAGMSRVCPELCVEVGMEDAPYDRDGCTECGHKRDDCNKCGIKDGPGWNGREEKKIEILTAPMSDRLIN